MTPEQYVDTKTGDWIEDCDGWSGTKEELIRDFRRYCRSHQRRSHGSSGCYKVNGVTNKMIDEGAEWLWNYACKSRAKPRGAPIK